MSLPTPPHQPPPQDSAGPAGEVILAAEQIVERAVTAAERSVAQRIGQSGLRIVLLALRATGTLLLLMYFAFGAAVLVTRYYLLPHIDDWRTTIESAASAALHAHVSVGRIEADWQGLQPRLLLSDVVLMDPDGRTALTLPQVDVVVSWTSLLTWQPRMRSMTVLAPEVEVRRLHDHRYSIAGFVFDPQAAQSDTALLDWVLVQQRISVRDARVHFVDELASAVAAQPDSAKREPAPEPAQAPANAPGQQPAPDFAQMDFTDVNFQLTRGLTGHRFALQLRPPAQLSGPIDLRGEFSHPWGEPRARMATWSGRIFVQFDYANLARLDALTHLVPAPAHIQSASGALRAWIDFSALQLTRLRADVALTDVAAQLRPDLQAMRLTSVQGRITQTIWSDEEGDSQEISLAGLRLDGPEKLHLPATDLLFRTTRLRHAGEGGAGEQSRFEASRIVLSDWSRLAAQLPLPANWLSTIERTAARGTLDDLRATWDGPSTPPSRYSLRMRFSDLGFALDRPRESSDAPPGPPATPAAGDESAKPKPFEFAKLAGSIELDQSSGSLRIDTSNARLRIPTVFDDLELTLDTLASRIRWSHGSDSELALNVDTLTAANDDIDLSASGSYRGGGSQPARLDLSGRLGRAKVGAVPRYLPTVVAGPARTWLHGALVDGRVVEGSFYLHGDPRRFPFADAKDGEFHAALRVMDGKLDVAPASPEAAGSNAAPEGRRPLSWPLLSAIDADVVFDRNRLSVNARHAKAYGYDLSSISARVPALDQPDQHLLIDGQGSGPLAEMLRYIGNSPVNAWTGGFLANTEASGSARLKLRLDIPLSHAVDTSVAGSVRFQADNLVLGPNIAPFSALTGQLDFTQRGVQFSGITAGFLGGEVVLSGDTQPDGTVRVQGRGSATPQGTKRQVSAASLRRLLDRTRGAVKYSAVVTVRHGAYALQVDSDLVGLAADLPEPFRKTAGETRALHLEQTPLAGAVPERDALRGTLGSILSIELYRVANASNEMQIERGAIAIGAHANVPDAGLLLLVDVPHLDLDRWQRLLGLGANASGAPGTPEAATVPGPHPGTSTPADAANLDVIDLVAVHAGTLTVDEKSITNVSLSARRDPDQSWYADIDSDQASGSLHWVGGRAPAPGRLTARLAKLAIPERDQKQVAELLDTAPTEFPALDIVADQFELGTRSFGHLEIEAQNTGNGHADTWNLQKLIITNPDGKLSASGQWQRDSASAARKMSVKISLAYSNAGALLGRFGLPGTIKNGSGKLEGELSWRGSPFAIDYPTLAGKMHLATEHGQFLKADAGAGRLLGVLSLQSLAHRVTGDFRDVFSEGFAFDTLTADASIANGTLTTDDFIMKGVNAVVRIKGSADLHAETQDLEVVVIPEINAGTASLAYALVNPAIGLGTFVANFLLRKPLSAAFTNVYQVTGPWSDPKVERVKTESGVAASRPVS